MGMIAAFRTSVGTRLDDPRVAQLVGELSLRSEHFRQLWARHDVKSFADAPGRVQHSQLGMLELAREKFTIGDSGQLLAIYHTEPNSDSARCDSTAALRITEVARATPGSRAEPARRAAKRRVPSGFVQDDCAKYRS